MGSAMQTSFGRRHPVLKWTALSLLSLFVLLLVVAAILVHRAEPILRARIVAELEERFHARVELDSFHVSLLGGLRAEGQGLRIWPPAQMQDAAGATPNADKPLIVLDDFRFRAPLHYAPRRPIDIAVVQLRGLTIDLPPKSRFFNAIAPHASASGGSPLKAALIHFVLRSLDCRDVLLTLETDKPNKRPLQFAISSLLLTGVQNGGAMKFTADLTNPRPVGIIHTTGTFGPWTVDDPGESPVGGHYTFSHANLGDFHGIAGTLDSTGDFQGALRNITVDGVTETPDFRLTNFGTPMHLHTQFHAFVDATNGDTHLEPVHATLGGSQFITAGDIVRVPRTPENPGGHLISLQVDIPGGHIEDFLRLTSKNGVPIMTGQLRLKSSVDIPPGHEPVHERLRLKGTFALSDVQFTSQKVQDRVAQLSLRGQGQPKEAKKDPDSSDVRATMQSDFTMSRAVIALPNLEYNMPGADIAMAGTYSVEGGKLDFMGTAKMQATISQMLGGWKGLLAKPVDRFFKKDGAGTEVPIHVDGTREDPHFQVDFNRMKNSSPERPDHPDHPEQPGQPGQPQ
jgi:hypothetical protein